MDLVSEPPQQARSTPRFARQVTVYVSKFFGRIRLWTLKIPWPLLGASVYGIVWLVEASCSILKLNIFNVMSLSLVRGSFSWLWGRLPWSMQQRIRRQKSRLVDTRMKSCSGHESCRTYGTHPCNEAQRCIIDFYFITEIVSSLSLVLLLRFIRQQMGAGEQETEEKEDWGSKK